MGRHSIPNTRKRLMCSPGPGYEQRRFGSCRRRRRSRKSNVQDLTFTKWVDTATPKLALACCSGKHFKEVTLVVRKAGEKPVEYLKIKMDVVFISSISTGGLGGEDRLTENVTLNFSKVSLNYVPQDDKGAPGTAIPMSWDIAANVLVSIGVA